MRNTDLTPLVFTCCRSAPTVKIPLLKCGAHLILSLYPSSNGLLLAGFICRPITGCSSFHSWFLQSCFQGPTSYTHFCHIIFQYQHCLPYSWEKSLLSGPSFLDTSFFSLPLIRLSLALISSMKLPRSLSLNQNHPLRGSSPTVAIYSGLLLIASFHLAINFFPCFFIVLSLRSYVSLGESLCLIPISNPALSTCMI